jgi:outer membrane protein OmpA-like peptidoglycan-associated protein
MDAAVIFALLAVGSVSAFDKSDEAKFKALEKAMSTPTSTGKKPHQSRAIVFDNEPLAPGDGVDSKPVNIADCAALPPDVNSVAVDFVVQFKVGSADIAPSSQPLLRQIAKILAISPDHCVIVEGHTDVSGNADRNMTLSRHRADAVVEFMVEKMGLEHRRLVPIGKGSTDTLKNLAPQDPKNRRVVFKVVG